MVHPIEFFAEIGENGMNCLTDMCSLEFVTYINKQVESSGPPTDETVLFADNIILKKCIELR